MTTPTTPVSSDDRPSHPLLGVFLPTVLTLAAVLGIAVWLLHGGGSNAPVAGSVVEQGNTAASRAAGAGAARGGVAELPDVLGRRPPPYVVYLVDSTEQQRAMTELGLAAGQTVLVAGTPEAQATAHAQIELLEMAVREASVAQAVRVVDLRAVRNATAMTAAPAPDQPHFTP